MFNAVFYHLQLLNLMIDGRELFAQRSDRIFNPKTFHVCFNLIEGKADSFHDANRIQIVKLAGTVIAGNRYQDQYMQDGKVRFYRRKSKSGEKCFAVWKVHRWKINFSYKPLDLIVTI